MKEFINFTEEDQLIYLAQFEEFIKIKNIKIGIDKLRLCYNVVNDEIITELEFDKPQIYELQDFTLYRIEGKHYNDIYSIVYNDVNGDGEIAPTKFGELRINLKSQDNDDIREDCKLVWIYVENKVLYDDDKTNYLPYIAEHLELSLNNLTSCEIYIDTTKRNVAYAIKQNIRNKEIITILNRKKVTNRKEDRPELKFLHVGDMDRYKDMALYVMSQKAMSNKANGTSICFYNKLEEIKQSSGKGYITDKYNSPKKLYRSEVRFNNEKFKEFLLKYDLPFNEYILFNKAFQWCVFEHFFNSIIMFKKDGCVIPLESIVL